MPQYKVDYVFGLGKQGWVETWYMVTGTTAGALAAATGAKLTARLGLTGKQCFIEAVRVSNVDVWGDSLVKGYAPTAGAGKIDLEADIPGASVLARVEATDLYRRPWLIRGVPDAWLGVDPVSGRPGFVDPAALDAALQAFAAQARTTPQFQLKVVGKGVGLPRYYVKDVVTVGGLGTPLDFTTKTPHGLIVGDYVLVSRVRYEGDVATGTVLNGRHFVSATTVPDHVQFLGVNGDPSFNYVGGGSLHKITTTFVDLTDIVPIRPGIRRTGRALFVPAGRRRARR